MTDGHVLPRLRIKRKRRKPPRPLFWFAAFWTVLAAYWVIRDVLDWMNNHDALRSVLLGIQTAVFALWWGFFRYEYKLWKDDNER